MPTLSNIMSQDLAGQIKKKEDEVAKLRSIERKTYEDYLQTKNKLSTVKPENLQEKANAKLWNLWIKCGEDIRGHAAQVAKAERELADLRENRAEFVVKDRLDYELELLR